MEITIKYSSKWGNSFLSDPVKHTDDELKNLNISVHKGRTYLTTLSKMNSFENKNNALDVYKKRDISLDTVEGVLYRLLGARGSLSRMKATDSSFFSQIIKDKKISFLVDEIESEESVYLKNDDLGNDQNLYSSIPINELFDEPSFSEYIDVLFYSQEQMIQYLLHDITFVVENRPIGVNTIDINNYLVSIQKNKEYIVKEEIFEDLNKAYTSIFEGKSIDKKSNIALLAMNKAVNKFSNSCDEKYLKYLTSSGTFAGISLNGKSYTIREFMKKFANVKKVFGNPYQTDFWVDNPLNGKNKKFNKKLSKSDGVLSINIDVNYEQAEMIENLIKSAGVSSFYLGKKGLAYISGINY